MLKRFFYASAAVLMLAIAYHLGAGTATAQAPSNSVVACFYGSWSVVTANGDVYWSSNGQDGPWFRKSNVFGSGPTPTLHESWGQLKARYRGNPVSTTPGTTDQ